MSGCLLVPKNTSAAYQPGVPDAQRVVVVLRCPGADEMALCRPAVGATGAHLCRVFHALRCLNAPKYNHLCLRRISIVNVAKEEVRSGRLLSAKLIENEKLRQIVRQTSGKRIFLLCGEDACRAFALFDKHDLIGNCVLKMCHMGQMGLNKLKLQGGYDKFQVLAKYIDTCNGRNGWYGWESLQKAAESLNCTLNWQGMKVPDWIVE